MAPRWLISPRKIGEPTGLGGCSRHIEETQKSFPLIPDNQVRSARKRPSETANTANLRGPLACLLQPLLATLLLDLGFRNWYLQGNYNYARVSFGGRSNHVGISAGRQKTGIRGAYWPLSDRICPKDACLVNIVGLTSVGKRALSSKGLGQLRTHVAGTMTCMAELFDPPSVTGPSLSRCDIVRQQYGQAWSCKSRTM